MKYLKCGLNIFVATIAIFSLCQCVAPINSSFESARMLEKGDVELMGGYARYSVHDANEFESSNSNITARIGIGVTDKFNLKARYTRLTTPGGGSKAGMNYFEIAPKFSLKEDKIAAVVPLGFYFSKGAKYSVVSPKLLFTYPQSKKFDLTLAIKSDIYFSGGIMFGANLGAGFSSDLDKWAIRPEIGLMSGGIWNAGIGVMVTILGPGN